MDIETLRETMIAIAKETRLKGESCESEYDQQVWKQSVDDIISTFLGYPPLSYSMKKIDDYLGAVIVKRNQTKPRPLETLVHRAACDQVYDDIRSWQYDQGEG